MSPDHLPATSSARHSVPRGATRTHGPHEQNRTAAGRLHREHRRHRRRRRDAREFPRVRVFGDLRPGAPGRPRRSEAGAAPHPLHDVGDGASARPRLREVLARGRRGHGQVPPTRRHRPVRRPGAARPGVGDAVGTDRRARQLRLARRPAGAHAIHRMPTRCAGPCDDGLAGRGRGRLQAELRRPRDRADRDAGGLPEPPRQRGQRDRGRHGHEHGAAQPRRGDRGGPPPHQPPGRGPRRTHAFHPRARPADRWSHRRPRRHPRRLRERPRHLPDPGEHPYRGDLAAPPGHRVLRAPLQRWARSG